MMLKISRRIRILFEEERVIYITHSNGNDLSINNKFVIMTAQAADSILMSPKRFCFHSLQ